MTRGNAMRALRLISLLILAVMASVLLALLASPAPPAHVAVPSTVALASAITASSSNGPFVAANAGDGNQSTYWESTNNVFPQWIQADLGASVPTNRLVLKVPVANWGARTQTFSVQGSTNGTTFTDLVASAGHLFDPAGQNTVTIDFGPATVRFIRLNITANTGWPAGQLSEFEVDGSSTGDTQPPAAPGNLAFTEPASGQIRLTWTASTDNVGVTNYDVFANGNLRTSVA